MDVDLKMSEARFLALENEHTAEDLRKLEGNLRGLLGEHLEGGADHLNLLNIACGRGDETGVLGRLLAERVSSAHLAGLDIRAAEIGQGRELWGRELEKVGEGLTSDFRVQRGDRLEDLRELESPDVVFVRHQNFWNGAETWRRIFDQALERMKEDGVFVMTSYFDREHEAARRALEELGAVQVGGLVTEGARVLYDAQGKSVDRHIAVFKKG